MAPRAVELAAEISGRLRIPLFFVPERARDVFAAALERGVGFDVAPSVPVLLTDDVEWAATS